MRRKQRHALGHYECQNADCGHKWKVAVKPPHPMSMEEFVAVYGGSGVNCQKCGHLYVKWANYDQWRKARDQSSRRKGMP
jgi:hypothetical protein